MEDDLKKNKKWKMTNFFCCWKTRMTNSNKMEDDLKKNGRRPKKINILTQLEISLVTITIIFNIQLSDYYS